MIIYGLSLSKCGKDIDILVFRYVFISMVEHSAVNRVVVGSSPTRGVKRGLAQFRLVIIWAPWSSG